MKAFCRLLLLALLSSASAFAAEPKTSSPLEPFLKKDIFGAMKISPTGEFLAVTRPLDDHTNLVILRRSDMKPTANITLGKNVHVADFDWVNPNMVLYSVAVKLGALERPQPTGELFRLRADGSMDFNNLVGMYRLIDDLPNEDDYVLLARWTEGETEFLRARIDGGGFKEDPVGKVPVEYASAYTDQHGVVRFAVGTKKNELKSKTYYRASDNDKWELINDQVVTDRQIWPRGFSADGKTAYLEVEETTGPNGVYAFDTTTRQRTLLVRDAVTDPVEFLHSPDGSLYAIGFGDGIPRMEYVDPDSPYAQVHRSLQASFPDAAVVPTSFTKDGNLGMYAVYSDRIPGDYYLFDRSAKQATYVLSRNSWLKPEMLNPTQTIALTARDGTALHGFLTVPKGSSGKNLPLVVHPHGGPFGVNDEWGYDPEVQLLADHGYAVLQLNFRGSSNYGRAFEHSGYKQWGGTMQDDLTDATRWAVAQGIADGHRICIYGASYGGYASLMGVAKEPDLYRCAIGYVGVYDMAAMYHKGDISDNKSGKNFLDETLGHANLAAISPNLLANRIKVPVMLAAGAEDKRAPAIHTKEMRDALLALGKPVETTIYDGEGHGNYLLKNQLDFYTKLLAFLDKNIGPAVAAPAPAK